MPIIVLAIIIYQLMSAKIKKQDIKSNTISVRERISYFFGTGTGLVTGAIVIGGICFTFGSHVSKASSNKEISDLNIAHEKYLIELNAVISDKELQIHDLRDKIYDLREKILECQGTSYREDKINSQIK